MGQKGGPAMNIQAMKQSLRQSIIAARSGIALPERQHLNTLIVDRLFKLEAYQSAVTVLGYMNFGRHCRMASKCCYLK
jgi:5-formyltetrahydrofolate cyclo-ligase